MKFYKGWFLQKCFSSIWLFDSVKISCWTIHVRTDVFAPDVYTMLLVGVAPTSSTLCRNTLEGRTGQKDSPLKEGVFIFPLMCWVWECTHFSCMVWILKCFYLVRNIQIRLENYFNLSFRGRCSWLLLVFTSGNMPYRYCIRTGGQRGVAPTNCIVYTSRTWVHNS